MYAYLTDSFCCVGNSAKGCFGLAEVAGPTRGEHAFLQWLQRNYLCQNVILDASVSVGLLAGLNKKLLWDLAEIFREG